MKITLKNSNKVVLIGLLFLVLGTVYWFNYEVPSDTNMPQKDVEVQHASDTVNETGGQVNPATSFTLITPTGASVSLSDYKGKVVIIDFWATWCPPCVAEIPHFVQIQQEYKNKGLQIIGISLDQNREKVPPFMSKNKINYPIVFGSEEITQAYGGIRSIPTTFILDKNHNIVQKVIGYRDKSFFITEIAPLL